MKLKRHDLPPLPNNVPLLELRYQAGRGDWYARTDSGWFFCRAGDVRKENREWQPCPYPPE